MIDSKVPAEIRTQDVQTLDEKVWQDWLAKGRLREQRTADRRMIFVKCAGIAILVATAVLLRSLSEYDLFIRLGVSLTGLAILFQAARLRRYTFVAIFAAIFVIYNPVVAVFSLSSTEALSIVVATTLPFAASLIWLRPAGLPDGKGALSSDASKAFFSSAKSSAL